MRSVITISATCMSILLFILINNAIISMNMRNNEVNAGIENAVDYAIDVLDDIYANYNYTQENKEQYINEMMNVFCKSLNEKINTDGDITVDLTNCDLDKGKIDIKITEEFSYNFLNKKGRVACERSVTFI